MTFTLAQLNRLGREEFEQRLSGVYLSGGWICRRAADLRPFETLAQLKHGLADLVRNASTDEQLALIRSQPALTVPFANPAEHSDELHQLTTQYERRFGFPFVLAVEGPRGTGLDQQAVLQTMRRRFENPPQFEQAEALRNLHRMAALRLNALLGYSPTQGNVAWDWAEALARHTDDEGDSLTVTYLTDAHRRCAADLAGWMRDDCGFDEVTTDAVGNVVGLYYGSEPGARRLLTGSHYDTVRNGGRFDGRLGIFVPMLCVQALHRNGTRLPFAIEVVGFAEEEGQRFGATFLGSGALAGQFDPAWLDMHDADGLTMREVMGNAGLDIQAVGSITRDPADYLGFVEVHIEQGPVLDALDLPLGVVSSINGSIRFRGEIVGTASHAGTTPMNSRSDAAVAAAQLLLYVEERAASVPDLVATVGMLQVPNGSVNVIAGRCSFSLDVRATTDAVRDACVSDIRTALDAICAARGVRYQLQEIMRASAAPSSPPWQSRWEHAVASLGLPAFVLPSGAGHDAMKMHEVMPQAMLFVRGENAGISHNPLESTNSDDIQLAVDAFASLLDRLANEPS